MDESSVSQKIKCAHDKIVELHKLQPHPRNPNKHPDRQIEILAKIIDHQGQRLPIVVSNRTGFIVAGHGRLQAITKLQWPAVAVDYQDFDTDADEYAHMIADNKIAELAKHDDAMMIEDIKAFEFEDFELLGLDDFDLPIEPDDARDEIEDDVPTNVDTRCKPGDVWLLGDHRLMCGDSTSIDAVDKLMGGAKADICFTSPPYNAGSLNIKGNETTQKKYNDFDDNKTEKEYFDFLVSNINCIMSVSNEIFYNIGLVEKNKRVIIELLNHFKSEFKDIVYWKKSTVAPHIQPGVINNLVEFILCFGNGKRKFDNAQFSQGSYWNVIEGPNASKNEYSKIHKATFPIYLPENIINNFSDNKSIILDTFGGSGSTLIACEKTNRKCYMMELDPKYCDVILSRWEQYSGKSANLCGGTEQTDV